MHYPVAHSYLTPEDGSFRKDGQLVGFVKITLDFLVFALISDTLRVTATTQLPALEASRSEYEQR
jgi:hypothetical protein